MLTNTHYMSNFDEVLDAKFGKIGTTEREEHRRKAYLFYMGQILSDARKAEKLTQSELAERVGMNKTYISRIEKGLIEPGISTFSKIIEALGLRMEIVKPVV